MASDCAQRAPRRRRRTDAAAGGRPGWPSGGSSRAARRGRRSACLHDVLREGVEQVGEQRRAAGDGARSPRPAGRTPRASAATAARPARPRAGRRGRRPGRRGARAGRRVAFVGDVVGGAREAIDRGDRRAQPRRAQPGGDREVLVVVDAHRRRFSMPRASTRAPRPARPRDGLARAQRCRLRRPSPVDAACPLSVPRAGGEIGRRTRFRS